MAKFKVNRQSIDFEYEFLDGEVAVFKYKEPTSKMLQEATALGDDIGKQLEHTKEKMKELIEGEEDLVERLVDEQHEEGNLFEFKAALDKELGKLKRRK